LEKSVFDVIEGGVDQHTTVIPCCRFDSDRLVNQGTLGEGLVRDGNSCQSNVEHLTNRREVIVRRRSVKDETYYACLKELRCFHQRSKQHI
jgi:hypothetical protein